jgi:predicted DsbA family dithiol-disulfide isomerase
MQIDIVSDLTCPWSFIGKRWLEQACAMRPEIRPEIVWHAFQIYPEIPPEGVDRETFLVAKFGSLATGKRAYTVIIRAAAELGIGFDMDAIDRTPNTREAHRLVRYATARGKTDAAIEALFRAYFVEGRDIGDKPVLARIAGEIGLDASDAQAFLAGTAELDEVVADDDDARRASISAVPCFIFNRRHAVCGAYEPKILLPILDAAERDLRIGG